MRTTPHQQGRGRSQLASMRLFPSARTGEPRRPLWPGRHPVLPTAASWRRPRSAKSGAGGAAGSRTRVPRPQEVRLYVRRSRMSRMRYSRTRQWSASTPSEDVPIGSMVEAGRWIPMSSLRSPYRASGAERHSCLGCECQISVGSCCFRRVITEVLRRPPARSSPPGTDHGRDRFSPVRVKLGAPREGRAHRRCPVVKRGRVAKSRRPRIPSFGTRAPCGPMVTAGAAPNVPSGGRSAMPV